MISFILNSGESKTRGAEKRYMVAWGRDWTQTGIRIFFLRWSFESMLSHLHDIYLNLLNFTLKVDEFIAFKLYNKAVKMLKIKQDDRIL